MQYQFDGGAMGNCRVEFRTAGKHGFAAPKIFQIACLESLSTPVYTFRFTNNVIAGATSSEFTNATLCRIAIAQFLLLSGRDQAGATHILDTTIPPFEGPVLNAKGVILTVSRLHSPRGMARVAEFPATQTGSGQPG
ncbi:MAG: hypothetical protein H7173_07135 [Rhodoferax sp.]|nr:hypothetical protein [Pseudorhodobacter sp.]